jgi:hypothetical protein
MEEKAITALGQKYVDELRVDDGPETISAYELVKIGMTYALSRFVEEYPLRVNANDIDEKDMYGLAKQYLSVICKADKKIKSFFSTMEEHEVIIVDDLLLRIMAHTLMEFVKDWPVFITINSLKRRNVKYVLGLVVPDSEPGVKESRVPCSITRSGDNLVSVISEAKLAADKFWGELDDKTNKKD